MKDKRQDGNKNVLAKMGHKPINRLSPGEAYVNGRVESSLLQLVACRRWIIANWALGTNFIDICFKTQGIPCFHILTSFGLLPLSDSNHKNQIIVNVIHGPKFESIFVIYLLALWIVQLTNQISSIIHMGWGPRSELKRCHQQSTHCPP